MQEPSASEGRRLNPAAILVWTLESAGRFGLAFVLPALNLDGFFRLIGLVGLIAIVAPSIIRYLRFRYELTEDSLIVQGGLLFQWRRVIPLARVQSVEVVQKLRHRMFDVVELRVEAVGGRQTEAALVALDEKEADLVRSILLHRSQEAAGDAGAPEPPPLARLETRDLLLAGVTGGRVAIIALLLGYGQELLPESRVGALVEQVATSGSRGLLVLIASVAAVLAVSIVVSLIATVFVYWEFTVRREDDRLVVTRGLLERRRSAVPLHRVQAVVMEENMLRRLLGLASLTVVTAGQAGSQDERQETSTLLPIGRRAAALDLAAKVLEAPPDITELRLTPAPARALLRRLTYVVLPACGAGVAPFFSWVAGTTGLVVVMAAILVAVLGWRALGHRIEGGYIVVRSGALVRRTTIVRVANIQHLQLTVSPTQRLYKLGTVRIPTAKGKPRAVDLDRPQAESRYATLTDKLLSH